MKAGASIRNTLVNPLVLQGSLTHIFCRKCRATLEINPAQGTGAGLMIFTCPKCRKEYRIVGEINMLTNHTTWKIL